jgi:ribosome-binding factor A
MKQTPASHKTNEAVRTAMANILLTAVSDPRLQMLTVTHAEVSRDRSVANVYVAAAHERYEEVEEGLASARGRLRSLVGRELGWKQTPELRFFIDKGLDQARAIDEAIKRDPHVPTEGDA